MIYGIGIALILICILFLPIKIELLYKEKGVLKVRFAGVPVYKKTLDKKEKQKKGNPEENVNKLDKSSKKLGEKIDTFRETYELAAKLLYRFAKLDEITVKIDFGTGDAPSTAVLVGVLWGIIYGVIGKITSICKIKNHNVTINPNFNYTVFSFEGKCIIKTSLVYIIVIAITILMKIKSRKGKEE